MENIWGYIVGATVFGSVTGFIILQIKNLLILKILYFSFSLPPIFQYLLSSALLLLHPHRISLFAWLEVFFQILQKI